MTFADTLLALAALVLAVLAVGWMMLTLRDGGRGHPPYSHEQDTRFLPPSLLK